MKNKVHQVVVVLNVYGHHRSVVEEAVEEMMDGIPNGARGGLLHSYTIIQDHPTLPDRTEGEVTDIAQEVLGNRQPLGNLREFSPEQIRLGTFIGSGVVIGPPQTDSDDVLEDCG